MTLHLITVPVESNTLLRFFIQKEGEINLCCFYMHGNFSAYKNTVSLFDLTFVAMRNLFQSSLLAAFPAAENSILFLSTG